MCHLRSLLFQSFTGRQQYISWEHFGHFGTPYQTGLFLTRFACKYPALYLVYIIITFISFVLNLFVWILGHFFIGSFWNTVKSHWPHFCMVSIHVNFNFVHLDSTIVAFYTKFNHTSACCSTWFHNCCISYKIQPQHKSNATLNFACVGVGWGVGVGGGGNVRGGNQL